MTVEYCGRTIVMPVGFLGRFGRGKVMAAEVFGGGRTTSVESLGRARMIDDR